MAGCSAVKKNNIRLDGYELSLNKINDNRRINNRSSKALEEIRPF
jgi:hypothetical protein